MAEATPAIAGFMDIDRTADPALFVRTLDWITPLWRAMRTRTYDLLEVREGHHILDAGCGTGEAALELGRLVGGAGWVFGVDRSATIVGEAERRAEGTGLPVEYRLADICQLPFADASFDGCRAERVLTHLGDPERALAELCRVTRPGGRVVVADQDGETRLIDAVDRIVTRKILNHFCDQMPSGWIGRKLPRLFRQAGLTDISVFADTAIFTDYAQGLGSVSFDEAARRAQAAGLISGTEASTWLGQLREAERAGHFFNALTAFVVSGRKP
jgi:SAM-dependent methyltransferase